MRKVLGMGGPVGSHPDAEEASVGREAGHDPPKERGHIEVALGQCSLATPGLPAQVHAHLGAPTQVAPPRSLPQADDR